MESIVGADTHTRPCMMKWQVTSCSNGVDALKIIYERKYIPDIVLLDVSMPILTGYKVRGLFASLC